MITMCWVMLMGYVDGIDIPTNHTNAGLIDHILIGEGYGGYRLDITSLYLFKIL